MKIRIYITLIVLLAIGGALFYAILQTEKTTEKKAKTAQFQTTTDPTLQLEPETFVNEVVKPEFTWPLSNANERITKKPFGIKISPQSSPVSPEKFTGIHSGTDFEIFPDEEEIDVPVNVICTGKILRKQFGRGYGGMIVQSCEIDGQPVVVTYGHVNLASSTAASGETLETGQFLANLGKGYSTETDGERKHLHLGIHKGFSVVTSGYVASQTALENFLDIQKLLDN